MKNFSTLLAALGLSACATGTTLTPDATLHALVEEYFDRQIRNEKHFEDAYFYIEQNPVKAKLCARSLDWDYSSASFSRRNSV